MPVADLVADARAVVFDAYGTLLDVHAAVAAHAQRIGPEAPRLSEIWRQKQLEYSWVLSLAGRYEPFWTLTERALDYALARHPGIDTTLRPLLLDSYRHLDAYPDAAATLRDLRRAGRSTAILSNGDSAMLGQAVESAGLGPHLDFVLSVEAAGVFKTDPRSYALVKAALAVAPAETLFVSSNRWDVAGAAAFGFVPLWINRAGLPDEYPGLEPVATLGSLDELVRP
jgi:2-haloacid dehalogenase